MCSLLQNFHPNFDVVGIKVLPPFFISIHTYFPHVSALDRLLNFMFNLDTSFQSLYGEESERNLIVVFNSFLEGKRAINVRARNI